MGSHGDVGIAVGTEGVALQTPSWTPANACRRWGPATGCDRGGEGTSRPVLSCPRAHLTRAPQGKGSSREAPGVPIPQDSSPRERMEQTGLLTALSVPLRL